MHRLLAPRHVLGAVLTTISVDWVVHVDYRVRRRRFGDAAVLVYNTRVARIDDFADAVWLACERDWTIGQIVRHVAERQGIPLPEALSAVVLALERFRALGFLSYDDDSGAVRGGAPPGGAPPDAGSSSEAEGAAG